MKRLLLSSLCVALAAINIYGQSNSNIKQIGTDERFQNINLRSNSQIFDFEKALKSAPSYKVLILSNNNLEFIDRRVGEFINVEFIDCSNNQLTDLPPEIGTLKKLKKIKLSNNKFSHIPEILSKAPNLEFIDISSSDISAIDINLNNFKRLKKLDLSKNYIKQFNIYGNNNVFEDLQLNNCRLNTIPNSICKISSLKFLGLSDNEISYLPNEILQLHNLQKLDISKNKITKINSELFGLQKLTVIDFSHNLLSNFIIVGSVPTNISEIILTKNSISNFSSNNLSSLKYLDISFQNVNKLIANLDKCLNLEILDISGNYNLELQGFDKLTNIAELDYLNADLREFPQFICNLSKLKKLNLANNNITSIPNSISNLSELEHLMLTDNQISYLPESFCSLQNIKWVWLDKNNLSSLPNNLTKMTSLKLLSIKNNRFPDTQRERIVTQLPKTVRVSF